MGIRVKLKKILFLLNMMFGVEGVHANEADKDDLGRRNNRKGEIHHAYKEKMQFMVKRKRIWRMGE